MKWFLLIVVLIVGGVVFYYTYYGAKPEPGTPHAVADAYVKAAIAGDETTIRSLCTAGAAVEAIRIAPEVKAMAQGQTLVLQAMAAEPPRKGLTAMAQGRVLSIVLIEVGSEWKIVQVGVSM